MRARHRTGGAAGAEAEDRIIHEAALGDRLFDGVGLSDVVVAQFAALALRLAPTSGEFLAVQAVG